MIIPYFNICLSGTERRKRFTRKIPERCNQVRRHWWELYAEYRWHCSLQYYPENLAPLRWKCLARSTGSRERSRGRQTRPPLFRYFKFGWALSNQSKGSCKLSCSDYNFKTENDRVKEEDIVSREVHALLPLNKEIHLFDSIVGFGIITQTTGQSNTSTFKRKHTLVDKHQ